MATIWVGRRRDLIGTFSAEERSHLRTLIERAEAFPGRVRRLPLEPGPPDHRCYGELRIVSDPALPNPMAVRGFREADLTWVVNTRCGQGVLEQLDDLDAGEFDFTWAYPCLDPTEMKHEREVSITFL